MKRSEIRKNIFKLVFCGEFYGTEEIPEQVQLFLEELPQESEEEHGSQASEEEQAYIAEKFEAIKTQIPQLDEKINGVAKGWKTDRMGKAELAILRLAVYEMLYDESVPVKVAINEAVELAKQYGGEEAPAFVNGILAKLVPQEV